MEVTTTSNGTANGIHSPGQSLFPSGFSKFNSALTAGLLNPMSPPPEKTRSSPTLFEMMANEPDVPPPQQLQKSSITPKSVHISVPVSSQEKQAIILQRVGEMLCSRSPGNQFNDVATGDVKLTLSSKDGISVSMSVHRQILVAHSRFFAAKLLDRWSSKQQGKGAPPPVPYAVEIADCDDVEVYIETLRLMYCRDLRRKLMREDVAKVLGILKVSAAIGFDAGVLSCLEYLEAAPWAEDEEEKVASLLLELRLEGVGANDVLKRVSMDMTNDMKEQNESEHLLGKLLNVVLEGKDEKARREMKGLVSKMLRDHGGQSELSKECIYAACEVCLKELRRHMTEAAEGKMEEVGEIARQADNVYWIADILMERYMAEDLVKAWAGNEEMAEAHRKVAAVHRYEVSRVTARMFVGIGKGQVLTCKETRWQLLQTWLVPFYEDFGWMRRVSKGMDRHLVEDGLSNTILTLPLPCQQEILLAWFHRFLNSGEDCPNIQRGFEVWWRRAFWRRNLRSDNKRPIRIIMDHNH